MRKKVVKMRKRGSENEMLLINNFPYYLNFNNLRVQFLFFSLYLKNKKLMSR